MQIFCDFDGTISTVDTTDHILAGAAPRAEGRVLYGEDFPEELIDRCRR